VSILVTGATGLLGSHVVERLVRRGESVVALARSASDTRFLESLGVPVRRGDLLEPESLSGALAGVGQVVHCAAKVGEWGPPAEIRAQIEGASANLRAACVAAGVKRVVHVSSVMVYGYPLFGPGEFNEDQPLGQRVNAGNHYCLAKIAAEKVWDGYPGEVVIVRPSWLYGERDRVTLPRVIKAFTDNMVAMVGNGQNPLNLIYAGDVAEGCVLALLKGQPGRAFNLTSPGQATLREFLDLVADELGCPRVKTRLPVWFAWGLGWYSEVKGKLLRMKRPPHLTRYNVGLVTRSCRYSIRRAGEELGWEPKMPLAEGIDRTLRWHIDDLPTTARLRRQAAGESMP
jgi:nucleoside-diphosphate-sugar epimerase